MKLESVSQNTYDDGMILIPSTVDEDETGRRDDLFAFAERQYQGSFDQQQSGVLEVETKQRSASYSIENEENKQS